MSKDIVPIGKIIEGPAFRDAVHVAICPVVCPMKYMSPGMHVGIDGRDESGTIKVHSQAYPHVGVIDPFLLQDVEPGQHCFLFIYPNTVTSLRHSWAHPAFSFSPPKE